MENNIQSLLPVLGYYHSGSKIYPNRWHHPVFEYIDIRSTTTIEDVLQYIYKEGLDAGIAKGELNKISQIKDVLNL
jgi:hypothetical protein